MCISVFFLFIQVQQARALAEKAQRLLENVANRKRSQQAETGGLVITEAKYGNQKFLKNRFQSEELRDELAAQFIDVTLPLNFLVNDSGQLKVIVNPLLIDLYKN